MKFPPRLIEGYRDFLDTRLPLERRRYQNLAETGQRPEVMVIGCCNYASLPEVIFDAHPGEFSSFATSPIWCRLIRRRVTHGVSAALEFAVVITQGRPHHRHGPFAMRRGAGIRRSVPAAFAGRIHR